VGVQAAPGRAMKIAYITAGAANMFCGSCLHDNTLAAALVRLGHDALLIPTYTPIRTDEPDVSTRRVFFGGINVYLQQKLSFFRHTPWFLDRVLDARRLLRFVSRWAVKTQAEELGALTVSMLQGEHGHQRKEIDKLVGWLASEVRPEIVNLTNVLLSGIVAELKRRLRVPVLATLQGDDIYLESLPAPYRQQALDLIRQHCQQIDGFIATSGYYADFMSEYLAIPRERIDVIYPGLNLNGHGTTNGGDGAPTIGYFARICPEKGFHVLADAFQLLRKDPGARQYRLRVSGWLGENNRAYFEEIRGRIASSGLANSFEHVPCPDHVSKVKFLQGLDVLAVPTTYREPKGLFVLEALANAVPVVQPRHGSFPELVEMTGGGLLVKPNDPADLANGLRRLLEDPDERRKLGLRGQEAIRRDFTADRMAEKTLAVYQAYLAKPTAASANGAHASTSLAEPSLIPDAP
jgi:glycosyltransferase involved in cell wall biosynthesis